MGSDEKVMRTLPRRGAISPHYFFIPTE